MNAAGAGRVRVGFVVEQALGHVAYGMSLRAALASRDDLECVWIEVPFAPGRLGAIPLVGGNWTLRGSLRAWRYLRQAEREARLDALFIHTQTISLFAGGFMDRIPALLSLDATPLNLNKLAAPYRHRIRASAVERAKHALQQHVIGKARHYTTWSKWTKDSLVADYGVEPANVTVVHPGTTITNFPHLSDKLRRYGAPLKALFVGGDFARKGGDLLLAAHQQHLRGICELHIVTGSDVPESDGVRVYHGVTPHSPELLRLYRESDVFVLPTRGDCLAVVLGEAMAAGLPIITTAVGGHPEAVEDGESGFVIDVDDADALRDRLQRLASDRDLLARMGLRARAIGEARFDMAKGAATIGDILANLARDRISAVGAEAGKDAVVGEGPA